MVSALLAHGADCAAVDGAGDNALHLAARHAHASVVRALLADCDVDAALLNQNGTDEILPRICRVTWL